MARNPTEFGKQVRALRVALGLSQAELGESSGLSERTISDLERGVRATTFPATARRLASALRVGEDDLAAFVSAARGQQPHDPSAARQLALRSPGRAGLRYPLTRLIGREAELSTVLRLVRNPGSRLVTIVGPGGIGKTRLANEVVALTEADFVGGSYVVNLSPIDDPEMVLPAIANNVGLEPGTGQLSGALVRRLTGGKTLVVLDTFEHVVTAAPTVGELVAACPDLTVLATSRAALRVRGEHEVPLQPLPVGAIGVEQTAPGAAMELFLERATAVAPDLPITARTLDLVSDICARLDGLPLAIELAAARVKHMPLGELLRHLDHRLDPLVGGARDLPQRHQTMRGALDWSYALLGAAEMRMFRLISVFRGGFGSEGAEVIASSRDAGGAPHVLMTLSALVDASLVVVEAGALGQVRYRLLDVVREYGVERALRAGEADALRRAHAAYFLALAERAEPELRRSEQGQWRTTLLEDEGNFRAALTWALEMGEGEIALRLAGALWMFWRWAGLFLEGRAWLDAALVSGENCSLGVRCQGLWGAGWLAFHQGDYRQTDELGRQMLSLLKGESDMLQRRNALTLLGNSALGEDRNDDAVAALSEAVALCEGSGTSWHLGTSLLNLGTAHLHGGRALEARTLLERALENYEQLGDRHFAARTLLHLGYAELALGEPTAAAAAIRRGMEISSELGDGWGIAEGLEAVATMRSESDPASAGRLAGAAEHLREQISIRPHPPVAAINRHYLELARRGLPSGRFEDAWSEGRGMTIDSAVGVALAAVPSAP